jgi:hypothetical protein
MGITHYWTRPTELLEDGFYRATADCARLIPTLGLTLAGFDGSGEAVFDKDRIVFNGPPGQNAEPFEVARVEFDRRGRSVVRSFCKTEGLPYDRAVQLALLIFSHHFGSQFDVRSDARTESWQDVIAIARSHLNREDGFAIGQPD